MQRIIRWLETKFFRREGRSVAAEPSDPEKIESDEIDLGIDLPKDVQELLNDDSLPGHSDYEFVDTVPDLTVDEAVPSDDDESTGLDPYDTADSHKK